MWRSNRRAAQAALLGVTGAVWWVGVTTWATEPSSRSSRPPENAEERTAQQLEAVLENQRTILSQLDRIMEELKIIKIRATLQ